LCDQSKKCVKNKYKKARDPHMCDPLLLSE
jgi:hypothetical protein